MKRIIAITLILLSLCGCAKNSERVSFVGNETAAEKFQTVLDEKLDKEYPNMPANVRVTTIDGETRGTVYVLFDTHIDRTDFDSLIYFVWSFNEDSGVFSDDVSLSIVNSENGEFIRSFQWAPSQSSGMLVEEDKSVRYVLLDRENGNLIDEDE